MRKRRRGPVAGADKGKDLVYGEGGTTNLGECLPSRLHEHPLVMLELLELGDDLPDLDSAVGLSRLA